MEDPPLLTRFPSDGIFTLRVRRFVARVVPTLLGLGLSLGLVGAGLWGEGERILGAPGGEVWGHAWVLFWLGEALPEWPQGPGMWLVPARDWVVVDPLPAFLGAVIARIGGPSGPIWGWNLVVLGWFTLAFLGGARLSKVWGGSPLMGGLFLGLSPVLGGAAASGLSEDLGVGLLAFCLAALVGPARPLVQGLKGGCWLGLAALCGPLLAFGGALVAVPWALAARGRMYRFVGLGLGVLPLGSLAILRLGERLSGVGHRFGSVASRFETHWPLNPWRGNDLASFLIPGRVELPEEPLRLHPAYLCWSVLVLATVGARGSRGILAWVLLLACGMVSVGTEVSWMGQPLGMANPVAGLLSLLPGGALVNHHGRLLLPGVVLLAALGARGVRRLQAHFLTFSTNGAGAWLGRGWVACTLMLFVLEIGALSPLGLPLPTADASVPTALSMGRSLETGALLVLPAGGPGIHFQRPLLDQRVHRRPIGLDPNRPGLPATFVRGPGGYFLANLTDSPELPEQFRWPERVGQILVMEPWVEEATRVLGEPHVRSQDSALWTRSPQDPALHQKKMRVP